MTAQAAVSPPSLHSNIYARATVHFTNAIFYKPAEKDTEQLWFKLSPLLIQASAAQPTHGAASTVPRIGALVRQDGRLTVDPARPSLYFFSDAVQVNGRAHARFAYFWCSANPSAKPPGVTLQGVRLTLDATGRPVIWEILHDRSDLKIVYAAESLEAAARARFGAPLPGRKHAVERSLRETPKTIVARVIDDGPMSMGPIVYLSANSGDVATLICRCMPAQATTLVQTSTYELLNAAIEPNQTLLSRALETVPDAAFRLGANATSNELQRNLRLPDPF